MANEHKIKIVKDLEKRFNESTGIYFTNYSGLSVKQADELRTKFRDSSVDYLVTKNTLTRIAAKNTDFGEDGAVDEICNGQIGVAYTTADPTLPARVIKEFKKANNVLEVVGLFLDGVSFSPEDCEKIASMPSKDELLTKICIGLNSPMTKLASTLSSSMSGLVLVLSSLKETKQ